MIGIMGILGISWATGGTDLPYSVPPMFGSFLEVFEIKLHCGTFSPQLGEIVSHCKQPWIRAHRFGPRTPRGTSAQNFASRLPWRRCCGCYLASWLVWWVVFFNLNLNQFYSMFHLERSPNIVKVTTLEIICRLCCPCGRLCFKETHPETYAHTHTHAHIYIYTYIYTYMCVLYYFKECVKNMVSTKHPPGNCELNPVSSMFIG